MNLKSQKNPEYYLELPWSYTIQTDHDKDGEPICIVSVNELPGVVVKGNTFHGAMQDVRDAMLDAFKRYLKQGQPIPEPINEDDFKGNIAYRTTSRRHYKVAKEAQKRGYSLSKVIDECIDSALL